jgi:hypothetical protein
MKNESSFNRRMQMPDTVLLEVSICGWIRKNLEFTRLDYFYFIHHAPHNSTMFYTQEIKIII